MSGLNLSEMENKILAYSWQCFKSGPPDIDYPKLALLVGHANHRSTVNAVAAIKKKLSAYTADGSSAPISPTKTKPAATPTKKTKASPAKKAAAVKTEDGDGDEEVDDVPAPRTTPKRAAATKKRAYVEDASSEVEAEEEVVERGRSIKREGSDEDGVEEPKTPEPKSAAKVKSKKEGAAAGKSPVKASPAKRVTKKAKLEMAGGKGDAEGEEEVDSGVEDGAGGDKGKEMTVSKVEVETGA